MAGWRETGQAAALPEHLDRYGGLPLGGGSRSDQAGGQRRTPWLADAVTEAGLTGRGGGGFPTGTKMRAVAAHAAAARGGAIVVANGVESEPASSKDEALLSLAPHLVLDGAVLAAEAVGAREVHLCLSRLRPRLSGELLAAVAERQQARMDPVPITVHALPRHYVASEETALIRWLNGGEAKPVLAPPRPHERGVRRRPTLVDNVETLAHIALIARYGPAWFRQAGRPDAPGTMLVTISGDVSLSRRAGDRARHPVGDVLARCGVARGVSAVLVGGYFGSWHDAARIAGAPMGGGELSRLGASPGCWGARRPPGGFLRAHRDSPGTGLPRRAERPAMRPVHLRAGLDRRGLRPARGRPGRGRRCSSAWDAGWRSSPDAGHAGTRTARSGWLPPRSTRSWPTSARTPRRQPCAAARRGRREHGGAADPRPGPGRGLVVTMWLRLDPTACTGHGLCAGLLPELIELDEWGYPMLAGRHRA